MNKFSKWSFILFFFLRVRFLTGCGLETVSGDVLDSISADDVKNEILNFEKQRLMERMAEVDFGGEDEEEKEKESVFVFGKIENEDLDPKMTILSFDHKFKPGQTKNFVEYVNLVILKTTATDAGRGTEEHDFLVSVLDDDGGRRQKNGKSHFFKINGQSEKNFISVPVTEQATLRWPDDQNFLLALKVECAACNSPDQSPLFGDTTAIPFLEIGFRYRRFLSRQKRQSPSCELPPGFAVPTNGSSECCKIPVVVSFDDLGWNLGRVYPDRYLTHFCAGVCLNTSTRTYTKIVQNVIREKRKNRELTIEEEMELMDMAPCCMPKEKSALEIVVLNNKTNRWVLRKIPGLIADECGC